jgi:hypothetical protein
LSEFVAFLYQGYTSPGLGCFLLQVPSRCGVLRCWCWCWGWRPPRPCPCVFSPPLFCPLFVSATLRLRLSLSLLKPCLWAFSLSDLRASCMLPMSYILVFIRFIPPITGVAWWLVLSCSNAQVQSLAHTHVGSSPIVGPFFCMLPISHILYPGVYKVHTPYHKRSLVARAFLF